MMHSTIYRKLRNVYLYKDFSFLYACLLFVVIRHFYGETIFTTLMGSSERAYSTEDDSNDTTNAYENIVIAKAKEISLKKKTVLLCVVNNAYLPLAYNWLCNTLFMGIHDSVLLVTTDSSSKQKLAKDWPDLNVVNLETDIPQNNQFYSHVGYIKIMILRTQIIASILDAGVDLMLLEFDFLWLTNPVPILRSMKEFDILLQPVSNSKGTLVCGGFMYIFATERSRQVFRKLTDMMTELETSISTDEDSKSISMRKNDQEYLSHLVVDRYGGISVYYLPQDKYADGKWYGRSEKQRSAIEPYVIHNNFIIGNKNKIKRAKLWKQWFVRGDETCDTELVNMTVRHPSLK